MAAPYTQHGLTMIEFMLALVAAALVVGALNGVVELALKARSSGRQDNELVYQGRFALERMISRARASAPKVLATPSLAGTTGDWFSPTMYCLKGGNRLVETTVSDTSCTGSAVIADHVIAFSAQPAGAGPVDDPVARLTLTLQADGAPITLTTSVRLGGGAL
jgi:prepilin-type N-terminal cleavage/methylation domain-containing protein